MEYKEIIKTLKVVKQNSEFDVVRVEFNDKSHFDNTCSSNVMNHLKEGLPQVRCITTSEANLEIIIDVNKGTWMDVVETFSHLESSWKKFCNDPLNPLNLLKDIPEDFMKTLTSEQKVDMERLKAKFKTIFE